MARPRPFSIDDVPREVLEQVAASKAGNPPTPEGVINPNSTDLPDDKPTLETQTSQQPETTSENIPSPQIEAVPSLEPETVSSPQIETVPSLEPETVPSPQIETVPSLQPETTTE